MAKTKAPFTAEDLEDMLYGLAMAALHRVGSEAEAREEYLRGAEAAYMPETDRTARAYAELIVKVWAEAREDHSRGIR
jgi:hypothetical protein